MRTDTKFTQSEVRTMVCLLVRNPEHPVEDATAERKKEWTVIRSNLLAKFGRIDARFNGRPR